MCETLEALCTVSKDGFAARAGEPLRLRGWQRLLIGNLMARRPDGRRRHRTALIGMPRKNGKSALGSGLALDGLLFDGQGAEVYSAAAEKEQGRIVFNETKRMVEANAELAEVCRPMRDVIEVPLSGSIYRVLSAEAYSKEGLNISRALVDELHAHPTDDLWNVLTLASGARIDPMVIAITTAGVKTQSNGEDTACYRLFKYGLDIIAGLVDDPSFFMAWWGAPDEADHRDPAVWAAANPGFGDLIDPEDFASAVLRTPENQIRAKRLNQWVSSTQAWLPAGSWDSCRSDASIPARAKVVLGFDGSLSNDSTGLVAASVGPRPHLEVVGCWDRPFDDRGEWRVPVGEVELVIREACKRWRVVAITVDPWLWRDLFEKLGHERFPVEEFPQNVSRMTPATQKFYEAVMNGGVSHSGDGRLAQHLGNAVLKTDARGSRLTKESKSSGRKIDLAVAAVMAFDRAAARVSRARVINLNEVAARAGRT